MDSLAGTTFGDQVKMGALPLTVRRGRKGLDPETLRRTAEVYLEVLETGTPRPLAGTAQRLYLDASSVSRRLKKAWACSQISNQRRMARHDWTRPQTRQALGSAPGDG